MGVQVGVYVCLLAHYAVRLLLALSQASTQVSGEGHIVRRRVYRLHDNCSSFNIRHPNEHLMVNKHHLRGVATHHPAMVRT